MTSIRILKISIPILAPKVSVRESTGSIYTNPLPSDSGPRPPLVFLDKFLQLKAGAVQFQVIKADLAERSDAI